MNDNGGQPGPDDNQGPGGGGPGGQGPRPGPGPGRGGGGQDAPPGPNAPPGGPQPPPPPRPDPGQPPDPPGPSPAPSGSQPSGPKRRSEGVDSDKVTDQAGASGLKTPLKRPQNLASLELTPSATSSDEELDDVQLEKEVRMLRIKKQLHPVSETKTRRQSNHAKRGRPN